MEFPDRRLLALLAGNFVVAVNFYIVAGLLDELAAAFGVSVAQAGTLISVFAITTVIGAPLFASLSSRIDRRRLLVGTLLLCALANLAASLSQTYTQMLAIRVFAALASAVFTPQAAATIALLVPVERRPSAMSMVMLGWSFASIFGVPMGVLIGLHFGWRAAFVANVFCALVVALLVWRLLPPRLHVPPFGFRGWIEVLRNPLLLALMAGSLAISTANQTVFSYLAPLTRQLLGFDGVQLSLLLTIHGVAAVCANLAAVVLLRRVQADRMATAFALCAFAGLLLWPGALLWAPLVFGVQFLWSLGLAGFPTVQQARLVHAGPALAGAAIALNSSAGYLGQALGASLGAAVWISPGPPYLPWVALLPAAVGIWFSFTASRLRPSGTG